MIENVFQGSLFTSDFLTQSIVSNADWKSISDDDIDALAADLAAVFAAFPVGQSPNETRTEDDLIWPVLRRLNLIQREYLGHTWYRPLGGTSARCAAVPSAAFQHGRKYWSQLPAMVPPGIPQLRQR